MRIFSDFHDYYDINLALGQDNLIVYNRKESQEKITKDKDFDIKNSSLVSCSYCSGFYSQEPFVAIPHFVGFCGKVYPLVEIVYGEIKEFCYNIDQVDSFVEKNLSEKEKEKYKEKEKRRWFVKKNQTISRDKIFNFFRKDNFDEKRLSKYFEKAPIFLISNFKSERKDWAFFTTARITYNPTLKEIKFFRVFDAAQTFQELYMWKSNQAVPLKEMPKIDDKTMRDIKGFDKFSFKKDKKD